jgi:hypothetical protein
MTTTNDILTIVTNTGPDTITHPQITALIRFLESDTPTEAQRGQIREAMTTAAWSLYLDPSALGDLEFTIWEGTQ